MSNYRAPAYNPTRGALRKRTGWITISATTFMASGSMTERFTKRRSALLKQPPPRSNASPPLSPARGKNVQRWRRHGQSHQSQNYELAK